MEGLTIKVFEVGELDSLAHSQNIGGTAETVHQHPDVTGVQGGKSNCSLGGVMAVVSNGSGDISPGGNDGGKNHQSEREEGHPTDGSSEPQDFTISNQDDGQVLEDGVDWNRQVLQTRGAVSD
jgi:hypothetical protein